LLLPPCPRPLGDWTARHSRDDPGPKNLISLAHPLLVLSFSSKHDRRRPPDHVNVSGTSPGVSAPSAHAGWDRRVMLELPGSSLPACPVSHRFTPCTPIRSVPALFHAGGALGVAPSRALILPKIRAPLGVGYPLVVTVSDSSAPCSWNPIPQGSVPVGEDGGQRVRFSLLFLSVEKGGYGPCPPRSHVRSSVCTADRKPLVGRRAEVRRDSPRARGQ